MSALSEGLSVQAACDRAKIGRTMYYAWRDEDPEFAAVTWEAIEAGTDRLEDIAQRRAEDQSDTLLIFLLKARRPAKYRETTRHEHVGDAALPLTVVIGTRPDGPQMQEP